MNKILISGLLLLCTACSSIPKTPAGFEAKEIETEHFTIAVWEKLNIQKNGILRVYIEGDGDPEPDEATALNLAAKDDYQNIVVLARPCQYVEDTACSNPLIWGQERYHPEIMREMQELTEFLIQKHRAKGVEFVAYDGGAPVAFNLAIRLGGAYRIITVAGILDLDTYTYKNKLPALINAENAAQNKKALVSKIPQIHYVGSDDKVTTRQMAERFVSRLRNPKSAVVKIVPDMGHTGWEDVDLDY